MLVAYYSYHRKYYACGTINTMTINTNKYGSIRVGKYIPVWWSTSRQVDGHNVGRILSIYKYTGLYQEWFKWVIRVEDPNTCRGWGELLA